MNADEKNRQSKWGLTNLTDNSYRLISLYYSRQKIPYIKVWTLIAELYLGKNTDKFLREYIPCHYKGALIISIVVGGFQSQCFPTIFKKSRTPLFFYRRRAAADG
jgi:hypothetical protein